MFTNTNVGQCHSQLVSVNHLGCKCNSLISCPHLLRLSTGGVMSRHAPMWVSTLITCSQWGVKEGVIATSSVCNITQKLAPSCAMQVASKFYYSWLHAIWHHMCHTICSRHQLGNCYSWYGVQFKALSWTWFKLHALTTYLHSTNPNWGTILRIWTLSCACYRTQFGTTKKYKNFTV